MVGDAPTRDMWTGLRDVFDPDFITEVERLGGTPSEGEVPDSKPVASGTGVGAA